ncbi:hypothetical protein Tco_0173953 [Tanacetum coccineum]
MDLKLEYNTFKAKDSKSLSQTYIRYKILLKELSNDGVKLSKHEMNVGPNYSLGSSRFQPKFSPKLIQSSQHFQNDQTNQNIQKDYKTKYKKVKAKLALLEAGPSSTQTTKPFQSKNKGIVAETFDYDKEKVSSDDEKMVQVKVLMTLVKEEQLTIGKNHARNDEITMRKEKKILGLNQLTETYSKKEVNENVFIPASLSYDHEMIPKSKDLVEISNLDSRLPNFNIDLKKGSGKTSRNISHLGLSSTYPSQQSSFNLNKMDGDKEEEEVQEVRPITWIEHRREDADIIHSSVHHHQLAC